MALVENAFSSQRYCRLFLLPASCALLLVRIALALLSTAKILCNSCLIISASDVAKYINMAFTLTRLFISGPVTLRKIIVGVCQTIIYVSWIFIQRTWSCTVSFLNTSQRLQDIEIWLWVAMWPQLTLGRTQFELWHVLCKYRCKSVAYWHYM